MKIYALYKGDIFLIAGTKEELATFINVKPRTIMFYSTKTYLNRIKENSNCYIVIYLGKE